MLFKRTLVLLMMLTLLFSCLPARAEFSPRYTALMEKEGIQIELGATFDTLSPVSDESLAILNDWLSRIRIQLIGVENAQRTLTQARVTMDGAETFGVTIQENDGYTLSAFSPSGSAYLTTAGEKDALSLISGGASVPLSLTAAADAYAQWAPILYPLLETLVTPKSSKTSTSIKYATASASFVNYTFKADEMNAAWPQILSTLLPVLESALIQQPEWYREAESLLSKLVFSGECRFKRFLDKKGGDMGLQFTGNAALGNDVRKVTLFGGYTPDKGGYISLSLPAVSGKNSLKISFAGKVYKADTYNTLTLEGSYSRTLDGQTHSATLDASLKNTIKKGNETWSGKITLTEKQKDKNDTWILTPELTFTEAGLQGNIALRKKEGETTALKCAVQLHMQQAEAIQPPAALAARDLRGMTEEKARAIAAAELIPLTGTFMQLLAQLPEESRVLLTHDLRTDSWMTAPSISPDEPESPAQESLPEETAPAAPIEEEGQWAVEEDPWADEIYWTIKEDTLP